MFGSEILEVAIGMSLIYLLMSALCSSIRELAEAWFKRRSVELERGIGEMLQPRTERNQNDAADKTLLKDVYSHPLVSSLYRGSYDEAKQRPWLRTSNLPSYIPSSSFSAALLDVVAHARVSTASLTLQELREAVVNLESTHPRVAQAIGTALVGAPDLAAVQSNLEAWYDSAMDRVAGWYKRRTQVILFILGLLLAIAMNVNTIHLVNYLTRNDAARAALVKRAEAAATDSSIQSMRFDSAYAQLDSLGLPIGWGKEGGPGLRVPVGILDAGSAIGLPLLGWLLTAFAIALGAPFWFDLLNKLVVIRSTVKPHEKSPEEGSEDSGGVRGGAAKHVRLSGGGSGGAATETEEEVEAPQSVDESELGVSTPPPADEVELDDAARTAPQRKRALLAAKETGLAPATAATAPPPPARFSVERRRNYVNSILKTPDRLNFLRPAQQGWNGGKWWHSFEKDGKTFRVAADLADTRRGTLTIVSSTVEGKPFGGARATFCNFNVSYCYHEAYGGPCLQFMGGSEKTANQLVDLLTQTWKSLTPAQAAGIANKGGFVIAGKKATGHGHVVFLLDDSDEGGDPAKIKTFHVGGGDPRVRTVADIWSDMKGVHFVTPHETFAEWQAMGG